MAVLSGQKRYTPPVNVQIMRRDLATLPIWYANPGDLVWCETVVDSMAHDSWPIGLRPPGEAVTTKELERCVTEGTVWQTRPWGLSPDSLYGMAQLAKQVQGVITGTEWKADYRRLTGRQTAAICLSRLRMLLPGSEWPQVPTFCSSLEEVDACIAPGGGSYVLKTPFSSSGRGLLWCEGATALGEKEKAWVQGYLRSQGFLLV